MKKTGTISDGGITPVDVYVKGSADEKVVCPRCEADTNYEEVPQEDGSKVENHDCPDCHYEFIVEVK